MNRISPFALAVLVILLVGAASASVTHAVTPEQCQYFAVGGKVQICHATQSARYPYVILNVSENACIEGHCGHPYDFVAVGDPTCQGLGCLPGFTPCDATLPCCDGLSCSNGVCMPLVD